MSAKVDQGHRWLERLPFVVQASRLHAQPGRPRHKPPPPNKCDRHVRRRCHLSHCSNSIHPGHERDLRANNVAGGSSREARSSRRVRSNEPRRVPRVVRAPRPHENSTVHARRVHHNDRRPFLFQSFRPSKGHRIHRGHRASVRMMPATYNPPKIVLLCRATHSGR